MIWRPTKAACPCAFALVAAAFAIASARAQQGNIESVRFYTVKPDRLADFLAATREYNVVVTKAQSNHYFSLWHSLTGANEYARVEFYTKWADLDIVGDPKMKEQAAVLQGLVTRILQCTEGSHRVMHEVLPDSSLPPTAEVPKMIRVLRTRIRPDKVGEFLALQKSDVLPAVKKSGLKFYTFSRVRYGDPSAEFVSVAGFNGWADLDGGFGVQKGLSGAGYQQFLAKLLPLIIETQFDVFSLVSDSSYFRPAR